MARPKSNPILFSLAELKRLAVLVGACQTRLFLFSHQAYLHYLTPETYNPKGTGEFTLYPISIPAEGILFVAVFQKLPGDIHFPTAINN